eukprot:6461847-Heterocapsa_arctica.AAC.1
MNDWENALTHEKRLNLNRYPSRWSCCAQSIRVFGTEIYVKNEWKRFDTRETVEILTNIPLDGAVALNRNESL